MEFVKVLLLVCAAGLPRGDCQVDTALDVIAGPANPMACGVMSQAYVASTAISRSLADGDYLKIFCGRGLAGRTAPKGVSIAAEPSLQN